MPSTINATPTSSGLVQSADASGVLALQTGGTTAVTIDGSQNVGIGTSSPSQKLDVVGTITASSRVRAAGFFNSTNVSGLLVDASSVDFYANNAFAMGINSGGDLVVGATSALYGGRVEISRNGERCLVLHNTATGSGANAIQDFYRNGTQVGSITTTNTNTTYGTSSDYRLKENIAPMTGALDKVAQLKPCTYNWKLDGSNGQGFIAHELQAVIPECVAGEKDAVDADGNIKPQGIDTSFLVATLTAAIQEQQALITQLQADVAALKVQP